MPQRNEYHNSFNLLFFALMTFGRQVIDFHRELKPNWKIPSGIELIFPFSNDKTWEVFVQFYDQFFSDSGERTFLFGINPGRFGAGTTGVPFTDPKILQEKCGIVNSFAQRHELSSIFVYDFIEAFGGIDAFYSKFYITSVCPLGFLKEGKNWNYYDDKSTATAVTPHIVDNIQGQLRFGSNIDRAYSMGKGKNFAFLQKLNAQYGFFKEIIPLPHPRWVMQYRLKRKKEFIDEYVEALTF